MSDNIELQTAALSIGVGIAVGTIIDRIGSSINHLKQGQTTIDIIYAAIKHNDIDTFNHLIRNINVNYKYRNDYTLLMLAVYYYNNTIVDLLINLGADLNIQSRDGSTALKIAAKSNNITSVKLLINARANLNLCDKFNHSALKTACYYGHIEIVELLLNAGALINVNDKPVKTSIFVTKDSHNKLVELFSREQSNDLSETQFTLLELNGSANLSQKISDQISECCICFEPILEKYVLVPCGHATTCKSCIDKMKLCPICQQNITLSVKIFE